jgi:hypothetical protein
MNNIDCRGLHTPLNPKCELNPDEGKLSIGPTICCLCGHLIRKGVVLDVRNLSPDLQALCWHLSRQSMD